MRGCGYQRSETPPVYAHRTWGDGSAPPLYVPAVERVDDALAADVEARLRAWAADLGFRDEELDALGSAGFGRPAMLTHPDTDDPEALLTAAKLNASWWAADDYYADDTALGAVPELLPPRLALVMSAMDPPPPAGDFTPPLEEALADDLVLRMLRSATGHLSARASTARAVSAINSHYICDIHPRSAYFKAMAEHGLVPITTVDLTEATIPYWRMRARSPHLVTGIEDAFIEAYTGGSFHYLLIAADRV